jgi:hypothetical protein
MEECNSMWLYATRYYTKEMRLPLHQNKGCPEHAPIGRHTESDAHSKIT